MNRQSYEQIADRVANEFIGRPYEFIEGYVTKDDLKEWESHTEILNRLVREHATEEEAEYTFREEYRSTIENLDDPYLY